MAYKLAFKDTGVEFHYVAAAATMSQDQRGPADSFSN